MKSGCSRELLSFPTVIELQCQLEATESPSNLNSSYLCKTTLAMLERSDGGECMPIYG